MIKKLPIIASSLGLVDVLNAILHFRNRKVIEQFESRLKPIMQSPDLVTTSSGIAAFYLILKALKKISNGREIVLPAYTAGSLVVAVQKAGFTPVLCDISRDDFNMNTRDCLRVISGNTLAVTPVHMFGIAMTDLDILRSRLPAEVYVLEDCCQAMGAMVDHKQVGGFGDISFFSFNRGKNFSSFGGGCICCNHADIVKNIQDIATSLEVPVFVSELGMFFKALFLFSAPIRSCMGWVLA